MVPTSNSYQFGNNTQLDDLFREAYERIGIVGNDIIGLHVPSAIMSANLELSTWHGRGLNFWLIQKHMLSLVPNQPIYVLPQYTVRVLDVVATSPVRLNSGGTAFSLDKDGGPGGGTPNNCFDSAQTAGCTQTVINGSIGYDYGAGNTNSIFYVGLTPLATSTYTLTVQYSFDMVNWVNVYVAPKQEYPAFQTTWFVVEQALNARAWRITETGGATLAIQQIYFSQPTNTGTPDRLLGDLSGSEWMSNPLKMRTNSTISGFVFNQSTLAPSLSPTLTVWPVPGPSTILSQTNLLYRNYRYAQDITQMFQNVEVPQRFYDALVAGIAARLALKFAPDRYQMLLADANMAYQNAANTDYENVPIRFLPNFSRYSVK
jgi:hypothetical protein